MKFDFIDFYTPDEKHDKYNLQNEEYQGFL